MNTPSPIQTDNWRAPSTPYGNVILFEEPGRIVENVDHYSHYFILSRSAYSDTIMTLSVKHGGGEESFLWHVTTSLLNALSLMSSDGRFLLFRAIIDAHHKSAETTAQKVNANWQRAAAEKRIKTRKMPGRNEVKVWIEAAPLA